MSRTVFILGAGASASAGAPLMSTFIRAATEVQRTERLTRDEISDFELVFKARSQLQRVFSKAVLDINNIEHLFGAFEMGVLLGRLGNFEPSELSRLPESIVRFISRTLERKIKLPVTPARSPNGFEYAGLRVLPAPPYGDFAKLLQQMTEGGRNTYPVSLITFNYDLALDYALHASGLHVDYCLEENADPLALHVLKLHGSLNWGRCPGCNKVVPWNLNEYFSHYSWSNLYDVKTATLEISNMLSKHVHCAPLSDRPVLVPPTWNKGQHHNELANVWRSAARHLSEAENLFIIGYSLPNTDEFFKYFYALGSVSDTLLSTVCIIDPDEQVFARFQNILGPNALASGCFNFVNKRFEEAFPDISKRLGLKAAAWAAG